MGEVAELHRRSARALLAMMSDAPNAEFHLRPGGVMGLSGEDVADFNMIHLEGAEEPARDFLSSAMRRVAERQLPVLVMIAPALADALAADAQGHGLSPAGSVPLMVQRSPAQTGASRACEIREVRDAASVADAMALVSSAFSLPLEATLRSFAPNATSGGCGVYVACDNGVPVSSVTVTREGRTAGVWSMATPPERQGNGWGGALLSGVIDQLRGDGVEQVYLFATAAGFPLYTKLGFETVAEEAVWVKGTSTQVHG